MSDQTSPVAPSNNTTISAAPGNANTVVVPKRAFNLIKTVALEFAGDHVLLKNNSSDWKNTGARFNKPEFKFGVKSAPISQTKDSYLVVKVTFEVWPYEAQMIQNCVIRGQTSWGLTFETKFPLRGGLNPVILSSQQKLPDKVTKLAGDIQWTIDNGVDGAAKAGASWGHMIYITAGKPMTDKESTREEDGTTVKRMSRSVEWVEPTNTVKPHDVVAGVRTKFKGYRLDESTVVPSAYKHPSYLGNNVGGAWPMTDFVEESGECQAQVRLIRALLRQLGVPGEAKVYVVWAEPDVQKGKSALEDDWEVNSNAGLNADRTVSGEDQMAALVDGPVQVGKTYPPSHKPMPDGSISPGLNRYEACLRFTADGETKYYGGGAGVYKKKEEVLPAFWGLIWVHIASDDSYRVVEIVAKYQ